MAIRFPSSLRVMLLRLLREVVIVGMAALLIGFGYQKFNAYRVKRIRLEGVALKGLPIAEVGMFPRVSGVSFDHDRGSLILVVSPSCQHCVASAPYYSKLLQQSAAHGVSLYVAVPNRREALDFVTSAGLGKAEIHEWKDLSFSVEGTPTLLFVAPTGSASRIWVGRLGAIGQSEVLELIQDPYRAGAPRGASMSSVSMAEFRKIQKEGAVLIDVQERPQFAGWHIEEAVNIPMRELIPRAEFELERSLTYVLDCSNLSGDECKIPLAILRREGFKAVGLGDGSKYRSCALTVVSGAN